MSRVEHEEMTLLTSRPEKGASEMEELKPVPGVHVNNITIRVSTFEFVFVVKQEFPIEVKKEDGVGVDIQAITLQRMFLSPQYAKAFSRALQESVATYEKTFGEIILEPRK
jgi:hypothetical protein